jgi:DNA-binding SARP family transcriptional activator
MFIDAVQQLLGRMAVGNAPVLHLFNGPFVSIHGRPMNVPEGSKRLLVFVALRGGPVERRHAAAVLWPVGSDHRAAGNLRSALWRLKSVSVSLLRTDRDMLTLSDEVVVDVHAVVDWMARMMGDAVADDELGIIPWCFDEFDLLPGWYDDWVLVERERVRQRLLHGLEAQSRLLRTRGRVAEAVEAAMVAINADPLRESAQATLIRAHLAARNWAEGCRRYQLYRDLLRSELGVEPGERLRRLIADGPPGEHAPRDAYRGLAYQLAT